MAAACIRVGGTWQQQRQPGLHLPDITSGGRRALARRSSRAPGKGSHIVNSIYPCSVQRVLLPAPSSTPMCIYIEWWPCTGSRKRL